MSMTLTPEIVMEAAASNRRLVKSVGRARDGVTSARVKHTLSPEQIRADLRAGVRKVLRDAASCADEWRELQGTLEAGMEGSSLRGVVERLAELFTACQELERAVRDYRDVAAANGVAEMANGAELDDARDVFARLVGEARALLTFLETPFPPIDWNRVRAAEQAFEHGETKPISRS